MATERATRRTAPWEVWRDLTLLATIPAGDRVVMRSSHCPSGCAQDRHSLEDSRFLRVEGEEGVIFEDHGPGAITRIWVTQGDRGVSLPLDPEVWIRIVVDDEVVVQLPLPDFFAGEVPPFHPPLTLDRNASSGGNISYVPIPYREGCRVSLLGAENAKVWFQITAHQSDGRWNVVRFTGEEDLSAWRDLLSDPGRDPWPGGQQATTSGETVLRRGQRVVIGAMTGPDFINGILLRVPRRDWNDVNIRLLFDGEVRVEMPLADFFAIGTGTESPTRSLLVGAGSGGDLYSYFPMPFFERAVVQLSRERRRGRRKVPVEYAIRRLGRPPDPSSGLFGADRGSTDRGEVGAGHELLSQTGRGKWVGLFAELGSADSDGRDYLEGDELVFLDGAERPQLHGTGIEDFFGGGFYFFVDSSGPKRFGTALNGMTYDRKTPDGESLTGMYRLLLSDAPTWSTGVRIVFEGGPTNQTVIRAKTVSYFYSAPSLAAE